MIEALTNAKWFTLISYKLLFLMAKMRHYLLHKQNQQEKKLHQNTNIF